MKSDWNYSVKQWLTLGSRVTPRTSIQWFCTQPLSFKWPVVPISVKKFDFFIKEGQFYKIFTFGCFQMCWLRQNLWINDFRTPSFDKKNPVKKIYKIAKIGKFNLKCFKQYLMNQLSYRDVLYLFGKEFL